MHRAKRLSFNTLLLSQVILYIFLVFLLTTVSFVSKSNAEELFLSVPTTNNFHLFFKLSNPSSDLNLQRNNLGMQRADDPSLTIQQHGTTPFGMIINNGNVAGSIVNAPDINNSSIIPY